MEYNYIEIFNTRICNLSKEEVIVGIQDSIISNKKEIIFTPNVDHIVKISKDDDFASAYKCSTIIVTDGMPLFWASRLVGKPIIQRIPGVDLFVQLLSIAENNSYPVYFLGSTDLVLEALLNTVRQNYPKLIVVGQHNGFFNDDNEVINTINSAKPTLLFIGMGGGKQEKWVAKFKDKLSPPIQICIGGSYEVICGNKKRAPRFIQKIGFEWLYRLLQDPQHLWKRYLVEDIYFFNIIINELKKTSSVRE
jgi:N-acetylglucosaminyldiphosphoundecaprenol N-acetyl-beta-D-mannosaminyltransferase